MLEKNDVIQESLPDEDVEVEDSSTSDEQVQPSDSEDVKETVDDDEVIIPDDRPPKNVIAELQRKLAKAEADSNYLRMQAEEERNQLISKFDELAQTMQKSQGSNQQTNALSRDQLLAMSQRDPENASYYAAEINKIDTQEIIDKRLDAMQQATTKKEQEREYKRISQQSYNDVVTSYPNAIKDGRWNDSDPVVKRMAQILHTQKDPISQKLLKDHPLGLTVAFNQAYREVSLVDRGRATEELKHVKRNVKKLQKNTLTEGGGKAPASGSSKTRRLAQLREAGMKSGDMTQYLLESGLANHVMGETE